jgi:rhamnogalacturonan endolyase
MEMMKRKYLLTVLMILLMPFLMHAQRIMEQLDRGLSAVPTGDGKVFVSWRLLVTDAETTGFNVYKSTNGAKPVKINKKPVTDVTGLLDESFDSTKQQTYTIRAILKGKENAVEGSFSLPPFAKPYFSIKLQTPAGYAPNDGSLGDLDGDGQYELIIHQVGRGRDNSQAGITDPPIIQAYKLDGTLLWSINLGKNIREGAHYTQFMVYDFDGDGRAEIAMKTADGSIDGKGNVIGDSTKDWRNARGYILAGPEFLTMFDGLTGEALSTVDYIVPRHPDKHDPTEAELKALWGDGYGNRMDRFLAGVAYLDGVHPSLIMCRGYYTRTVLAAWDFKDKKLVSRWVFDSNNGWPGYAGQGNHSLSIADVDGDGKDEIIYGAMTVDDDGKGLYSTGLGHGDALHVSDLDPERPGLEVFDIQERFDDAGANLRDARTGEVLWKKASIKAGADGEGPGRGVAFDVDPRYPGMECWVAGAGITGMFDCKGNKISEKTPSVNMAIYWDGDLLRELLDGTRIDKWDYENSVPIRLLDASNYNCVRNNGTKSNPVLSADFWGDWREEVIYRTADNNELRIFSTPFPSQYKFYTFMQDPQYRLSIVWQNVAYNQPPHPSFYVGPGMKQPPKPSVVIFGNEALSRSGK